MPAPRPRFWDLGKDASASLRSVLWFPQGQQVVVVVSADFWIRVDAGDTVISVGL